MALFDGEKTLEKLLRIRPSFYREKIDNLNEKLCVALAGFTNSRNQFLQARQKPIVPDTQQWATGNVADARGFNDNRGRLAFGKSSIPVQIILSDLSIFSRAPGNHGGNPGAAFKGQGTNPDRSKQERLSRLFSRWPTRFGNWVFDRIGELPHQRMHFNMEAF